MNKERNRFVVQKEIVYQKSFFDMVNDYCDAEKIKDIISSCELLITYVIDRIPNVDCYIQFDKLWIKRKNNKSLSTDLISQLLNLDIKNIDDSRSIDGIWSIHLYRR
ncbi:MAG: hypothetical protein IKF82_00555 [Bacilli bacterium]|nr:hypothetical protein [Bacilli bacterium]